MIPKSLVIQKLEDYSLKKYKSVLREEEDLNFIFFLYRRKVFLGIDYLNNLIIVRYRELIIEQFKNKYDIDIIRYPYLDSNIWISIPIIDKVSIEMYKLSIDESYNILMENFDKIKH